MPLIGPEGRKQLRTAGGLSTVALTLLCCILIGYFGGQYLDGLLGTTPILAYVGIGLGNIAGFLNLYREVQRARRALKKNDPPNPEPPNPEPQP